MKFREDFVTNSSSSSYIVSIEKSSWGKLDELSIEATYNYDNPHIVKIYPTHVENKEDLIDAFCCHETGDSYLDKALKVGYKLGAGESFKLDDIFSGKGFEMIKEELGKGNIVAICPDVEYHTKLFEFVDKHTKILSKEC